MLVRRYLNVKATNGESFADQYKRVAAFLDEVRQKEGENTVVFAHGGVLICAQIYAKLIHPEEAFQAVPAYGGVFYIKSARKQTGVDISNKFAMSLPSHPV